MISLLKRIFLFNWQRKLISFVLAMIVWIVVNHSISATKTVQNVPVKVANLPTGKTVQGLNANSFLDKTISLCLTGNKHTLDKLSSANLMVVLDAERKGNEWIAQISKYNIVCTNQNIDLSSELSTVTHPDLIVKLSNLVTEKVSIIVTDPIGKSPKGYRFVDVWPYHLSTEVTGPEELVKKLKRKQLKLTFNLNDISKEDLDNKKKGSSNHITFSIPEKWKKVHLPEVFHAPLKISDPRAKNLRIDFVKQNLIPLNDTLPVSLFFPPQYNETLNPDTFSLNSNADIQMINGITSLKGPFYAKDVSPLFVEVIKNRIHIVVIPAPLTEKNTPLWNVQFIYPHELEDKFVKKAMEEPFYTDTVEANHREEYLRNRFRNYMHRFRIYNENNKKIQLEIKVLANKIDVRSKSHHTAQK